MTLAEYRKRKGLETPEGDGHDEHAEKHPGALEYAQIGGILAFITAVEVGLYYINLGQTVLVVVLMTLSALKFGLVVLWFMHLKFDHPLFSSMFMIGVVLALSIFTVAMATIGGKLV